MFQNDLFSLSLFYMPKINDMARLLPTYFIKRKHFFTLCSYNHILVPYYYVSIRNKVTFVVSVIKTINILDE
jgi:hypothetical protein